MDIVLNHIWKTHRRAIGALSLIMLALTIWQNIVLAQANGLSHLFATTRGSEFNAVRLFGFIWFGCSIASKFAMILDYRNLPINGLAVGTLFLYGFVRRLDPPPTEVSPTLYIGSIDLLGLVVLGFIACDIYDFLTVNRFLDTLEKRWHLFRQHVAEEMEKKGHFTISVPAPSPLQIGIIVIGLVFVGTFIVALLRSS